MPDILSAPHGRLMAASWRFRETRRDDGVANQQAGQNSRDCCAGGGFVIVFSRAASNMAGLLQPAAMRLDGATRQVHPQAGFDHHP